MHTPRFAVHTSCGHRSPTHWVLKDSGNYALASEAQQRAVVALCYYAIFFNIGAVIVSFVMMDYLGEVPYQAAQSTATAAPEAGRLEGSANTLLKRYSGSPTVWVCTLLHCKFRKTVLFAREIT